MKTVSTVPLIDLKPQYASLRDELLEAATRVLDSGRYILGPEVAAFEAEFARAQGVPRALGMSSGTDAIMVALEAAGVRPGDEVIVPAFTFIATATVVNTIGAVPVFADVDDATLTLDPADAAARCTRRTKAIVPVHLYGWPADLDPILTLARKRGLAVIEDCAQAHLTRYKGRAVGGLGDAGCFSFYPSKNLGAAGDAGAVVSRRKPLLDACGVIRDCGRRPGKRYEHARVGRNCRLDELQAALLRVKLRRLEEWTEGRRRVADRYRRGLAGLPLVLPPADTAGSRHTFHQFTIQTARRDALASALDRAGIGTGVYYPIPLHLQPAYAEKSRRRGALPRSERAAREALSLPMFPELPDEAVDAVCAEIRGFLAGG